MILAFTQWEAYGTLVLGAPYQKIEPERAKGPNRGRQKDAPKDRLNYARGRLF